MTGSKETLTASTEIPLEISCGKITLNPSIDIRLKDILNQLTFKAAAVLAWLENAKTLLTPLVSVFSLKMLPPFDTGKEIFSTIRRF